MLVLNRPWPPHPQAVASAGPANAPIRHAAPGDRPPCLSPPFPAKTRNAENPRAARSEEHTSELQSLMRISYAVFCLKKKIITKQTTPTKHIIKKQTHTI